MDLGRINFSKFLHGTHYYMFLFKFLFYSAPHNNKLLYIFTLYYHQNTVRSKISSSKKATENTKSVLCEENLFWCSYGAMEPPKKV